MTQTLKIAKMWLIAARQGICIKVSAGVFLQSRESLIEQQKEWDDEDEAKTVDFTSSPFWITTDDGANPIGIESELDLVNALK